MLFNLEAAKAHVKKLTKKFLPTFFYFFNIDEQCLRELLMIYIERKFFKVMSIGSIVIRDIIQNFSCLRAGINLSYLEDKDTHSLMSLQILCRIKY